MALYTVNDDDTNDQGTPSPDDALEETRGQDAFNPYRDQEKLEQDYDPPSAPPDDVRGRLQPTPTDDQPAETNVDTTELYDAGLEVASSRSYQEGDPTDPGVYPLEPQDSDEEK